MHFKRHVVRINRGLRDIKVRKIEVPLYLETLHRYQYFDFPSTVM